MQGQNKYINVTGYTHVLNLSIMKEAWPKHNPNHTSQHKHNPEDDSQNLNAHQGLLVSPQNLNLSMQHPRWVYHFCAFTHLLHPQTNSGQDYESGIPLPQR